MERQHPLKKLETGVHSLSLQEALALTATELRTAVLAGFAIPQALLELHDEQGLAGVHRGTVDRDPNEGEASI